MTLEREVHIKGNLDSIWDVLNKTLSSNKYKIKQQTPKTHLVAEKGSRLVSGVIGGIKGGYHTIDITLAPSGNECDVLFKTKFSALGGGLATQGAMNKINQMLDNFVGECSQSKTVEGPKKSSLLQCPHCNAPIQKEWKACPSCGNKLSLTCPNCNAEIQAGWKACPACGNKL